MKSPISGYYGGKSSLSNIICEMIPTHTAYVEPFFGGGSVFFAKPKSKLEIINDKDNRLYRFWVVCRDYENQLYERFDKVITHETEYRRSRRVISGKEEPKDEIDYAYCVFYNINTSMFKGFNKGFCVLMNNTSGTRIYIKKNYLKDVFKRLAEVFILNRDALKVIKDNDRKETFFYLDPPYPETYQWHYSGYTMEDFNKLCDLLKTIKGKFLLSCYLKEGMDIDPNWNKKIIKTKLKIITGKENTNKAREECLIYNYELDQLNLGI